MNQPFQFVTLLLFLMSCVGEGKKSSEVNSDEIYQKYIISYDQNKANYYARAEFIIGGKWNRTESEKEDGLNLELSEPARIEFNGQKMEKKEDMFSGVYYSLQKKSIQDSVCYFLWKDNKGKTFTNAFSIHKIWLPYIPDQIDCTKEFILQWGGTPVGTNETIIVSITGELKLDDEIKKKSITQITSDVGLQEVSFSPEQLQILSGCKAKIEITRKSHIPVNEGGKAGGFIDINFEGQEKSTKIVERPL
jgi:hypothetical protein